jgi:membrane protease YdiL (CAAX protease family)
MPWDFVVILAVMGIFAPLRGYQRIRELLRRPALSSEERIAVYFSTMIVQWPAALIVLWRAFARGLRFEQLGIALPDPQFTLAVTAVLSAVLVVVQVTGLRRMARLPAERQGLIGEIARKLMPATPRERRVFVFLVITVAVCEEILYRGFALAAFDDAFAAVPLSGAFLSSALFALAHLYQGTRGIVMTFFVGLIFAGARQYTGSLVPCIAAHLLADLLAGLRAPHLLGPSEAAVSGKDKAL